MATLPVALYVFSGKRKSGKDFITDLIQTRVGKDKCAILRLSAPLKSQYAKEHGLDFKRLLDASAYKEKYRASMIKWGEDKRKEDPGYFCHLATQGGEAKKPVWLISDARRLSDVEYFRQHYPHVVHLVRVAASDAVRKSRGWVFTPGIDDSESECGLDEGVSWDIVIENSEGSDEMEQRVEKILQHIQTCLKKCR